MWRYLPAGRPYHARTRRGQAITYFPILGAVFFLSAIKVRYVIGGLVLAAVMIPTAYIVGVKAGVIKRYQQDRIMAIIDPESVDPRGYGYHTIQSMITVGKGGLSGIKEILKLLKASLNFSLNRKQTLFSP